MISIIGTFKTSLLGKTNVLDKPTEDVSPSFATGVNDNVNSSEIIPKYSFRVLKNFDSISKLPSFVLVNGTFAAVSYTHLRAHETLR